MGIHMKNNINYTGATSLNTLRDVVIDSPATGQGIVWDEEKQQWTNGEVSTNDMVEITLAEYEALSTEEKHNDTTYFITDADNIDPRSVGTAGILKPWLYDSDEEVIIGVYDGKPLYRKTLVFENHSLVDGDNYIELDIDIDKIVNTKAFNTNSNHTYYQPMNQYVWNLSGSSMYYFIYPEEKYIYIRTDGAWPSPNIYFTLEYTKTTDAENSGVNLMPYSFVQNDSGCNYSTEEQIIGRWIDGRPIYQKTITDYDILNTTNRTVLIAENLDFLTSLPTGIATIINALNGSVDKSVLPRIAKYVDYQLGIYATPEGYITIDLGDSINSSNYSSVIATITFQYTKTTD